jgi:hypothetical protein
MDSLVNQKTIIIGVLSFNFAYSAIKIAKRKPQYDAYCFGVAGVAHIKS